MSPHVETAMENAVEGEDSASNSSACHEMGNGANSLTRHTRRRDSVSSTSSTISQDHPDTSDDPDDRTHRPALFLRRFWRKVASETPAFRCYRDPRTKAYACTLTLSLPPSSVKTFKSPAVYTSKRAAINALADYAMNCGVLQDASRSMAATDRSSSSFGPRGSITTGNPIAALPSYEIAGNPVTLLNLAVQKYCIEPPNVAVEYVHSIVDQPEIRGYVHRCQLNVRITPDITDTYTTSACYPSTRQAKEAAAQLALEDGIVVLLKLHNSLTTKICRHLGEPIPTNIEDHDTAEEDNTAGILAQLVQQVIGRPDAIATEYKTCRHGSCELFGAKVTFNLKERTRSFEMPPLFRNKREAKECCCRLAVRLGIKQDLAALHRLFLASRAALDGVTGEGLDEAGQMTGLGPLNARDRLAKAMQTRSQSTESLVYTLRDIPEWHSPLGRVTRFGCSLEVKIPSGGLHKFEVEPRHSCKKDAKEAVASLAIEGGLLDALVPLSSLPADENVGIARSSSVEIESFGRPERTYHTARNQRALAVPPLNVAEDLGNLPPPPYVQQLPGLSDAIGRHSINNNAIRQAVLPVREIGGIQTNRDAAIFPFAVGQPYLDTLRSEVKRFCGRLANSPLRLQLVRDVDTGRYGGRLTLVLPTQDDLEFSKEPNYTSAQHAEEGLATDAIQKGILLTLERTYGATESQRVETILAVTSPASSVEANAGTSHEERIREEKSKTTSFHPVSHVHQICQLLLDSQAPTFEVLPVSGHSGLYKSRLIVPTIPPTIYASEASHSSKAAARQAIAETALANGLVDQLKRYSLKVPFQEPTPIGTASAPAIVANEESTSSVATKLSYREQLIAYCLRTERPPPCYASSNQSNEVDLDSISSSAAEPMVNLTLRIGLEIYELDVKGARDSAKAQEKLAKMVLKHLSVVDSR